MSQGMKDAYHACCIAELRATRKSAIGTNSSSEGASPVRSASTASSKARAAHLSMQDRRLPQPRPVSAPDARGSRRCRHSIRIPEEHATRSKYHRGAEGVRREIPHATLQAASRVLLSACRRPRVVATHQAGTKLAFLTGTDMTLTHSAANGPLGRQILTG